jgi:hypothetical protein
MDILKDKTRDELLRSLLAEAAKSKSELATVRADLDKVTSRIGFLLVVINHLMTRKD